MSILDQFEAPKAAIVFNLQAMDRIASLSRILPAVMLAFAAVAAPFSLASSGHPFLAAWFGLALFAWLFILGAARTSDDI
jgi:hypothetical protein